MKIHVVYAGRNYPLSQQMPSALDLPAGASLAAALAALTSLLEPDTALPASCLVAVSGTHAGTVGRCVDRQLRDGDELLLIAPVAGG